MNPPQKNLGTRPCRARGEIVNSKSVPVDGNPRTLHRFPRLLIVSNRTETSYFGNDDARHFANREPAHAA